MEIALPPPSEKLKKLMDEERAKPDYQNMDSGTASLLALENLYKLHGDSLFDFTNTTDDIIRMTLTGEPI